MYGAPKPRQHVQVRSVNASSVMFHNFIFMVFSGAMVGIFAILTTLVTSMRSVKILENILENKFIDDHISYTPTVVEALAKYNRERDGPLNFTLTGVWAASCLSYLAAFCGLLWTWNRKRQTFRNNTTEDGKREGKRSVGANMGEADEAEEKGNPASQKAASFARRNRNLHTAVVVRLTGEILVVRILHLH
ncbi:hypothetical protein SprV_0902783600 [Sparganum proliferum]